jgi:hypothetical protein
MVTAKGKAALAGPERYGVTVPVLEFGRELRGSDRKDPAIGAPLPPTARAKAADVRFY